MSSSPANKARLLSASASHASAWLLVAPSVGLNLHLHSPEFQTAVRWWLGLDTSFASVCPLCPGVALDSLSHHAVSCRHGGDTAIRHNKLRDIVADLCRKAHLSVRVEAGHGMCHDNNHSRPADVLVEGWERGQPAALDITVTSPLTPVSLRKSQVDLQVWQPCLQKRGSMVPMTQSIENWDGCVHQWQLKCIVTGGRRSNTCSPDWLPI